MHIAVVGNDIVLVRKTKASSNTENVDSGFVDPELIELRPVIKEDNYVHADHLIRAHNKVLNETRYAHS